MNRKSLTGISPTLVERGLFPTLVYGPVRSRRLGLSLGINPLPLDEKLCSFNCPYCQFGWTGNFVGDAAEVSEGAFPSPKDVSSALEEALEGLASKGTFVDSLTFAGNGEPTLHPKFPELVDSAASIRDRLMPGSKLSVLTNGSTVHRSEVLDALNRLDDRIVKLDAGDAETIGDVNIPHRSFDLERMISHIPRLTDCVLQSMFVEGRVDNTSDDVVARWISRVGQINPLSVQVYTLDRIPADRGLIPVDRERLRSIARRCQETVGVACEVY